MAVLQVGRVGVDAEINMVAGFSEASSKDGREVRLTGFIKSGSLAETQAIRTELLATVNSGVIPITWTEDPTINGFYHLSEVNIDGAAETRSLTGAGFLGFSLTARHVGNESNITFQSRFTGNLLANNSGLESGDGETYWAPPVGATSVRINTNSPVPRTTSDGEIVAYRDIDRDFNHTYQVSPANYYLGGAYVKVGGYTRAGLVAPNDVGDWELGNGLIRATPYVNTQFDLDIDVYDGSTWDALPNRLRIRRSTVNVLNPKVVSILHNTPEMCAVRIVGELATEPAEQWTMDLQVRRGSRIITGIMSNPNAQQGRTYFDVAGDDVVPDGGGTPTTIGSRDQATSSGNRAVVYSATATTFDDTAMSVLTNPNPHHFAVGAEVDYPQVDGDGEHAKDLALQYVAWISEVSTPILT
jgi:hypothetical protein